MKNLKRVLIGGLAAFSLLAMACGGGPSQEELQTLVETRQAAESAEEQVQELQQQKRDLEDQLQSKKEDLERAKAEKARVEKAIEKSKSGMAE